MKRHLADLLASPDDGTPLELTDVTREEGGEVVEGTLRSQEGHEYAITGGVARLLPEDERADGARQEGTRDSFGMKWGMLAPQDWGSLAEFQYDWYLRRYGLADEDALAALLAPHAAVLDAGSGLGRDVHRFARLAPDAQVIGLEISSAVDHAHEAFGAAPNVHYVQGDIMRPPLRRGTIGALSCDQVIHHTPDPRAGFAALVALLTPAADVCFYTYKVKAPLREAADDVIRETTTRMSFDECLEFSRQMTMLGRVLTELDAKVSLPEAIPLLGIEAGEHDVQRLVYWHFLKCFYKPEWSDELNDLTNLDWYHPPYASRHTREELERWAAEEGLEVVHVDLENESGISVRARRG